MKRQPRVSHFPLAFAAAFVLALSALPAVAAEVPKQLPDPGDKPPSPDKPVKVYILAGQSNMVGIGQMGGGSQRWSSSSAVATTVVSKSRRRSDIVVPHLNANSIQ